MFSQKFNLRFTTALILMGSFMVLAGRLARPIEIDNAFTTANFQTVHTHQTLWIWSYRFLIFGLFIQIMALASFKALSAKVSSLPVLASGIIVCSLALFVATLSEGYYMHIGAWGGWKLSQLSDSDQPGFMESLSATHEWVICLTRMGYMFFCLGLVPVGWSFFQAKGLRKITGIYSLLLGVLGILFMMIYDKSVDIYVPVQYGILVFFVLLAFSLPKNISE